jgi:hypothetical protein
MPDGGRVGISGNEVQRKVDGRRELRVGDESDQRAELVIMCAVPTPQVGLRIDK